MQLELDLFDKVRDIAAVDALDRHCPLVGMVDGHPARAVAGVDRVCDVAVDDWARNADALVVARERGAVRFQFNWAGKGGGGLP